MPIYGLLCGRDMEMASAIARRYGLSLEGLHREYWDHVGGVYVIDKMRLTSTRMCRAISRYCAKVV